MKLSEFLTYFTDTIFRRDVNEWRNPVVRWLVQQYRLLFYTARGLLEHGTIVRSAALTFYTLMSLVPIVAVVFAVCVVLLQKFKMNPIWVMVLAGVIKTVVSLIVNVF